ncbi:Adhesion G protein-coupled receptor B3 (Brain-specific angiogenesis inhibitor 3), partial [Durusdinium trenchii]
PPRVEIPARATSRTFRSATPSRAMRPASWPVLGPIGLDGVPAPPCAMGIRSGTGTSSPWRATEDPPAMARRRWSGRWSLPAS